MPAKTRKLKAKKAVTRVLRRAPTNSLQKYMRAHELAKSFGVSTMCIWRWRNNPDLRFPSPYNFNGVGFWKVSEIEKWVEEHAA